MLGLSVGSMNLMEGSETFTTGENVLSLDQMYTFTGKLMFMIVMMETGKGLYLLVEG